MQRCEPKNRTQGPGSGAERTCVVCRESRSDYELVRLSVVDGVLRPVVKAGGRGVYVCLSAACLAGLNAKSVARAFRQKVEPLATERLHVELHELARARVLEMIGLARRNGQADWGVEAVVDRLDASGGDADAVGTMIRATDLSARNRRLAEVARAFVDGLTMGHAAGMGYVGAMNIRPGRLSRQAAYWLAVWYETGACEAGARA